jgi:hypothetical protein
MVKFIGVTQNIISSFFSMYKNMENKITTTRYISVSHEYIAYWGLCEFMMH